MFELTDPQTLISAFAILATTITGLLYARRSRRAEARRLEAEAQSREISVADQMIDLVRKASEEAYELNRRDSEKLRKAIIRLERAIREISTCDHRDSCPVTQRLQGTPSDDNPQ